MIGNLPLYYRTIKYLKWRQLYFQVLNRIKKKIRKNRTLHFHPISVRPLTLLSSIPLQESYRQNQFSFLNRERFFDKKIDWNFGDYGKLWTYNLNYFDFLHQVSMREKDAVRLIDLYCSDEGTLRIGLEPYPISLRGINWIKFFTKGGINNHRYNNLLYDHYQFLASNVEYHLMGNHLLENGFSLLFASYYFNDDRFYKKARKILIAELNEQLLNDGAHFELSPMYHQIILFRLLDCINLIQNNGVSEELSELLLTTAIKMIGWLKTMTFQNGDIPMVNDSINNMAPSSAEIFSYADRLGINSIPVTLSTSGYRMIRLSKMELFIDIGNIGPDYIPGHSHSDTFNFILYVNGSPLIVETGTSTYAREDRRIMERSTSSHNTVRINGENQTEVWASFRVGRRAKIIDLREGKNEISASHDGYEFLNVVHRRTWKWSNNNVVIIDELLGNGNILEAVAFIHFHPKERPKLDKDTVRLGSIEILVCGYDFMKIEPYQYAASYGQLRNGEALTIYFRKELEVAIKLIE